MNKIPIKPKTLLLYFILFGSMFIFGFIGNIKGVSYPLIKAEFGISYELQGTMVSLHTLSYMLFCLIGGILIGSLGVKKTFIAGFIFMFAGLGSLVFMPGFWHVTASLLAVFACFGLFEVSSNALAAQLFTSRAALLMSLMHFFYGAGSSLGPRVAGALSAIMSWRYVYLLSVPLVLLFFIASLLARFPDDAQAQGSGPEDSRGTRKVSFLTALKTPMVWFFAVVLGLMVTVETSSENWSGLYFQDVYQLDPKTSGAAFISNFFILFTISRLLSGFVIEKAGYLRSLFIAVSAAVLTYILGFVFGAKGLYILPVLGFFVAVFWPTILAVAMVYFGPDAPVMTSAVIVIASALNSGLQYLIGLTNSLVGPAWGYRSCLLYAVLIIVSLAVLAKRMRRPYIAPISQ
jgi:fucose permease